MTYPVPENEAARLETLWAYGILDTPRDARFDQIASLAARQLGLPMAFVTLIDRERQWFKSCVGMEAESTAREVAFCAHAICAPDEVLVVEDAQRDARFAENPLVRGAPFIRFYAGAPIVAPGGDALGSLCVVGTTPQTLGERERDLLMSLASVVMDELELHAAGQRIKEQSQALAQVHERTLEDKRHLEHFVQAAAHDLRAPLRTMDAFSTMLGEQLEETKLVDLALRIKGASGRLSCLIDDLLAYAQLHASQAIVEAVNLNEVLATVLLDLTAEVEQTQTVVEVDALPTVVGVESRLRQLFQNLLTNAIKFHAPGRRRHVWVTADAGPDDDGLVTMRVRDNGRGFDPEFSEAVFEPFRRLQGGDKVAGSGLGLTLSRQVARDAGGDLTASAQLGEGAVFTVRLPAARRQQAARPAH